MPLKIKTRRRLIALCAVTVALLLGGLAFTSYFMHSVYEVEAYLESDDIPASVQTAFAERFPGAADVEWKSEDNVYEASCTWEGMEEVESYFSPDGTRLKTEFPATIDDLPEKARAYLRDQSGLDVAAVERVEAPDSPLAFEVELGNLLMEFDCEFDREGNLLARHRDGSPLEEN